jgi:anti-sigma factor RsiW
MKPGVHPADEQLLGEIDGEISRRARRGIEQHLEQCWRCRARRQELQNAIGGFVRAYREGFDLPPGAGPRAMLKAKLAECAASEAHGSGRLFATRAALAAMAACALLAAVLGVRHVSRGAQAVILIPDARLTPGATLLVNRPAVCAEPDTNNKTVPSAVRQKVFEEYGIRGADPRAYEVDYLVTPALGGADDIHNLWPHSYAATVWNARVKDALEERLRTMVCDGSLDLAEAQREIASNWIAAYQKYFHTEQPLGSAAR